MDPTDLLGDTACVHCSLQSTVYEYLLRLSVQILTPFFLHMVPAVVSLTEQSLLLMWIHTITDEWIGRHS